MKTNSTKMDLVTFTPNVDIEIFRLTREPGHQALANDVIKFTKLAEKGIDQFTVATFLSGVQQIKLKALCPNAKRGVHGGGDGWMKEKQKWFPGLSNSTLSYQVVFTKAVFAEAQNPKIPLGGNLGFGDPLSFELPESPDELRRLLTGIHNVMDGKTITAICRSSGRIRDAIAPGSNSHGSRKLSPEELADIKDPLLHVENELISVTDENDLTFAQVDSARLARFNAVLKACYNRTQSILKSRTKS